MKTSIKFGNDTRNVLFTKDNLPTIGAVLGTLSGKAQWFEPLWRAQGKLRSPRS